MLRWAVALAPSEAAVPNSVEHQLLVLREPSLALRPLAVVALALLAALAPLGALVAVALVAVAHPSEVVASEAVSEAVAHRSEVASVASPSATLVRPWGWVGSWAGSPVCSEWTGKDCQTTELLHSDHE